MIIITGSSGGIGLKLTELLSKYNKILGIYHKNKPKKKLSNVKFIDVTYWKNLKLDY